MTSADSISLINKDMSVISQNESANLSSEESQESQYDTDTTIDTNIFPLDNKLSDDSSSLTSIKRTYVKKSRLERELEISMTPKMTYISFEKSSPENASPNTSRYGRARKQKTIVDFYPTDVAIHINSKLIKTEKSPKKSLSPIKSPIKSPKKTPVNVNSPSKLQSTPLKMTASFINGAKTPNMKTSSPFFDDDMEPIIETKLIHTPWNENAHKVPMKVYVRKDLIQRKREQKEETGSLIKNMFSPLKPCIYSFSSDSSPSPVKNDVSLERSITEESPKTSPTNIVKLTNQKSDKETQKKTKQNLVKTTPENMQNSLKESEKSTAEKKKRLGKKLSLKKFSFSPKLEIEEKATSPQVETNGAVEPLKFKVEDFTEEEAACSWKLGELAWARVGSHPFWPCLITRDPTTDRFLRKKTVGRSPIPVETMHVTFFADSGRRSWLLSTFLMKFEGLEHFNKTREEFTPEIKKKNPKFCAAFNVSENKKRKWLSGVEEAEMLMRRPPEHREHFFITMLLSPGGGTKKLDKPKKEKKLKSSEVSLSESLFDSLFDNQKIKSESDVNDEEKSIDHDQSISEVTKTNGKPKTQTHMDRWLLKTTKPNPLVKVSASKKSLDKSKERGEQDSKPKLPALEKSLNVERRTRASKSPASVQEDESNTSKKLKSLEAKKGKVNRENESNIPLKKRKLSLDILIPEKETNGSEVISGLQGTKESDKIADVSVEDLNNDDNVSEYKISPISTPRIASLRNRNSNVNKSSTNLNNDNTETDSKIEESNQKETKRNMATSKTASKYDDLEFQEFLEFKRDALLEENPDLTEEYVLSYLYKAWQYGESQKPDEMRNTDDFCLVKGMADEVDIPEPKKQRKRNKEIVCDGDDVPPSPTAPREKILRRKSIKSYFKGDSDVSDLDEESKKESTANEKSQDLKTDKKDSIEDRSDVKIKDDTPKHIDVKVSKKVQLESKIEEPVEEIPEAPVDHYMASLSVSKPNIFRGYTKEKVCEICEKPSGLSKCKGPCGGMYHLACVQKQLEPASVLNDSKRLKKRKKRGKKAYSAKKKNDVAENEKNTSDCDSGDESQANESVADSTLDLGYKTESGLVIQPHLNGEVSICPSPVDKLSKNLLDVKDSPKLNTEPPSPIHIVTNAEDFESQLEKLQELMETSTCPDFDISSTSSTDGFSEWENVKAGECVIVDVMERLKSKQEEKVEAKPDPAGVDLFKCNDCQKYDSPVCFVCKSVKCLKSDSEVRQKCNVPHCNKFYHIECLKNWPQTQYSTGGPSKNQKKSQQFLEAMSCPRHVCHTCVSDDPRGCRTRFPGDKLARCARCPATYHSLAQCVPAGSRVLTASQIVCPRHCDSKPSKILYHVNTSWCFICAKGGSLICCETCPTSFHAECLKISPPEGGYICEDCETGRLPLYGELVWVKLGHYRWWPALVLHPCDVPPNIAALPHTPNQFAVRFFGDYDHYWVNTGRVFPYQEGDTGHASSKKSTVDNTFLTAVKQAQEAYEIVQNLKQRDSEDGELVSSVLPPQYVKLKVNRAIGGAAQLGKGDKKAAQRCDCNPTSENPCGPDSDCLNRMLLTECSPSVCAAGERCGNQAFEKRLYPSLAPSRTSQRGWGLKALVDIKKGDFVIEYVGEVIDEAEFQRRMSRKQEIRDENYYFLTLDKDRMIDAGPKGNVARFMNHSCEPNCETQKWTVNGDTRVGLFALRDIPAGIEVTFNYNLVCAGDDKKKCLCGAKRCAGYIGAKPKQEEAAPKKLKKIPLKRKYSLKKKPEQNSPSASPVVAKVKRGRITTPNIERNKLSASSDPPAEVDGIEQDWKQINEAASKVDDKKPEGNITSEEKIRDPIETINKLYISKSEMIENEIKETNQLYASLENLTKSDDKDKEAKQKRLCKGFERVFENFIIEKKIKNDAEAMVNVKRKRLSKASLNDSVENSSLEPDLKKKTKSISLHSKNQTKLVTDCNDDIVSIDKVNGHVIENGFGGESVTEKCKIVVATTDKEGKGVKAGRGRPRKSLLVDEI